MGSWEYVREIFDEVVDAPVDERSALLETRCGQDTELRDAVERLLVAAECEDFLIDGNLVGDFLGSADGADELDRPLIEKHAFDEGQTLAERFRVVRYIGRGGMGEVYEAYDPDLGRSVALKTVRSEYVGDALSLRRFMREIRMALAVTHPNVCRIYDVHRHLGEDGNEVLFLAMELLKGETVAEFIKRRGKISTDEAGPIVRQMCDALGAIHEKGIVHRDFTPKNVMLDGDRVVVTDFGLARPQIQESGVHSMTVTGQVLGVPDYMAPEQLAGAEVTGKADIYALGVIAYEMVTGRKPFAGETPLEVAHAKTSGSMTDPAKHAIDLPERWRTGLLASIQIEPAKRPTPGQLASVIGGGTELALPTIVGALDSQPAKIAPGGAYRYAIAVALFLALAALFVYGSRFKGDGGETPPAAVVKNIVVLPFQTHGESADVEAFSAGLIDSLTSGLSQYQGEHDLSVVPTSEVSRREISTASEALDENGGAKLDHRAANRSCFWAE